MILEQETLIQLRPTTIKWYLEKGYVGSVGQMIAVRVEDLPPATRHRISIECDCCGNRASVGYKAIVNKQEQCCYSCSRKRISRKAAETIRSTKSHDERSWKDYKKAVWRITERNYHEQIDIINPERHKRARAGVIGAHQLDHRISMKYGFEHGVAPEVIGSTKNLQILPWKLNRSKHDKVSVDLVNQILQEA